MERRWKEGGRDRKRKRQRERYTGSLPPSILSHACTDPRDQPKDKAKGVPLVFSEHASCFGHTYGFSKHRCC